MIKDAGQNAGGAGLRSAAELISLKESVAPLREHFNANRDRLRFITLLSPT